MTVNVKQELINHLGSIYTIQNWDFVVCASISLDDDEDHDPNYINLTMDGDVQEFIDKLDMDIYSLRDGFHGTIWYADSTWSEYIYDYEWGTGQWIRFVCPEIPDILRKEGD